MIEYETVEFRKNMTAMLLCYRADLDAKVCKILKMRLIDYCILPAVSFSFDGVGQREDEKQEEEEEEAPLPLKKNFSLDPIFRGHDLPAFLPASIVEWSDVTDDQNREG